jgi:hypothetical protein
VCDVCGRTLLRGERAHAYLDGAARRSVCELCTSRALNEGWVLEGTERPYEGGRSSERRRSLFGRLKARRDAPARESRPLADRLRRHEQPEPVAEDAYGYDEPAYEEEWPPPTPPPVAAPRAREQIREPRHVRAIPTSAEQKFAAAIDAFNRSEHRRTVAGVARSLGAPTVAVHAVDTRPGLVDVTVSWELCWYRYEVDLSEDQPGVRVAAQGYELEELPEGEKRPNAVADENGSLALAG